jgi:predicted N-formylglutamate amidohydrolase
VLWDQDARVALPLLQSLQAIPDLVVGDNLAYSGRHPADYTVHRHGATAGRRHVCIEVRQDEIADEAGVKRWAQRLCDSLLPFN